MDSMRSTVKQVWVLLFLILIIFSVNGCSGNKNDIRKVEPLPDAEMIFLETAASAREIAWNHLSNEEKNTITIDWKTAPVKIVQWDEVPIKKTSVKPGSIYKVTFRTNQDQLVGPIGIYVDPASNAIIGYDARK